MLFFDKKYWEEEQLPKLKKRINCELNFLNKSDAFINIKEYEHRRKKICNPQQDYSSFVETDIFQIAHEIDTAYILSRGGQVKLAKEITQKSNIDIEYLLKYKIECTCGNQGNEKNVKINKDIGQYHNANGNLFDTLDKKIMYNRLINSIDVKIEAYKKKYIPQQAIDSKTPYLISITNKDILGTTGINIYDNGCELLEILFGININSKIIKLDLEKVIKESYLHVKAETFYNKNNDFLSGIIYSNATWDKRYYKNNTFLFVNPNAKNKIDISDFLQFNCWIYNDNSKYYEFKRNNKKW